MQSYIVSLQIPRRKGSPNPVVQMCKYADLHSKAGNLLLISGQSQTYEKQQQNCGFQKSAYNLFQKTDGTCS